MKTYKLTCYSATANKTTDNTGGAVAKCYGYKEFMWSWMGKD